MGPRVRYEYRVVWEDKEGAKQVAEAVTAAQPAVQLALECVRIGCSNVRIEVAMW